MIYWTCYKGTWSPDRMRENSWVTHRTTHGGKVGPGFPNYFDLSLKNICFSVMNTKFIWFLFDHVPTYWELGRPSGVLATGRPLIHSTAFSGPEVSNMNLASGAMVGNYCHLRWIITWNFVSEKGSWVATKLCTLSNLESWCITEKIQMMIKLLHTSPSRCYSAQ